MFDKQNPITSQHLPVYVAIVQRFPMSSIQSRASADVLNVGLMGLDIL